jgi:hypothetical protein
MEGTPRLADRGRSPFKPQTALLRGRPPVGVESHSGEAGTNLGSLGFCSFWQLEGEGATRVPNSFHLLLAFA